MGALTDNELGLAVTFTLIVINLVIVIAQARKARETVPPLMPKATTEYWRN